jgi:hypothetical protein
VILFIATYTLHSSGLQLPLFYTLSSSPLHTHQDSPSSLVVSWQRIYHRLTVTSHHTLSLLNSFLAISAAASSNTTLDYCCVLRCTPSTTATVLPNSSYNHFARVIHRKHSSSIVACGSHVITTQPVYWRAGSYLATFPHFCHALKRVGVYCAVVYQLYSWYIYSYIAF